ncbi:unnamed protein product [Lactuca saligna]|uniref:OTU domain-containing protein n=1 Tax=Lactuca saligna TaxID=75948 RepID=A0AA35YDM1_LACSI|nr:unnamed protein product [Lactuca saligna]
MHDPFLMKSIPDVFHDYIDKIQDVLGDGNCGFRAVAVSLGHSEDQWLYIRQQLLEELESQFYAYQQVFTDGFNEIQDVLGDGNCGFRAVAVSLGHSEDQWLYIRQQLLEELESQFYAYQQVFTDGFNESFHSRLKIYSRRIVVENSTENFNEELLLNNQPKTPSRIYQYKVTVWLL